MGSRSHKRRQGKRQDGHTTNNRRFYSVIFSIHRHLPCIRVRAGVQRSHQLPTLINCR
ncbi:Unknown protein sequence [Pseudomonas syringae pv. maculicola]|nr:Unknown protein sequence [Pseudomonas syringae pv. maculicola]